ncbi:MAG: FtsQ-type POTRA domain-containing protein [Endomicrobiales bacterium]|nr:FtsQ-type POTRA domain-containing protein [Endomicrobiales bacterium]
MRLKNIRKRKFKVRPRSHPVMLRSKFKRERTFKIRKLFTAVVFLAVLSALGWAGYKSISYFVFDTGYFDIKKIEIKGLKDVTQSEIMALLPFRLGDNLFKVWISVTEKNLRECKPELKKVDIKRKWQRLLIKLEERKPIACLNVENRKFGIDEDNIPFPLRGVWAGAELPEIVAKDTSEREDILDFIELLLSESKDFYDSISRFYIEPGNNIVFVLKNDTKVYWGPAKKSKLKPKIEKLLQVKEEAKKKFAGIEYINMNYFDDGRIVVKPSS